MILNYLAIVSLILAVVLQVAVLRAPETAEVLGGSKHARRILIVGMLLCAIYVTQLTYQDLPVDALVAWGLVLLGLAEVTFCINRLFPQVNQVLDELTDELSVLVHPQDERKPHQGPL